MYKSKRRLNNLLASTDASRLNLLHGFVGSAVEPRTSRRLVLSEKGSARAKNEAARPFKGAH